MINLGWKSSSWFIVLTVCYNWKFCPGRLETVQRTCQTLSAGAAAKSGSVPCCVALHLHKQL